MLVLHKDYYFRINRSAGPEAKHPALDLVLQSSDSPTLLGPHVLWESEGSGPSPHKMLTLNTAPSFRVWGLLLTPGTRKTEGPQRAGHSHVPGQALGRACSGKVPEQSVPQA